MYLEAAPEDVGKLTWSEAMAAAQNYKHSGFSDWYLPSIDELKQLCTQRVAVGNQLPTDYWSSSDEGGNQAWTQHFGLGDQTFDGKYYAYYVRPVRAFSI